MRRKSLKDETALYVDAFQELRRHTLEVVFNHHGLTKWLTRVLAITII